MHTVKKVLNLQLITRGQKFNVYVKILILGGCLPLSSGYTYVYDFSPNNIEIQNQSTSGTSVVLGNEKLFEIAIPIFDENA